MSNKEKPFNLGKVEAEIKFDKEVFLKELREWADKLLIEANEGRFVIANDSYKKCEINKRDLIKINGKEYIVTDIQKTNDGSVFNLQLEFIEEKTYKEKFEDLIDYEVINFNFLKKKKLKDESILMEIVYRNLIDLIEQYLSTRGKVKQLKIEKYIYSLNLFELSFIVYDYHEGHFQEYKAVDLFREAK